MKKSIMEGSAKSKSSKGLASESLNKQWGRIIPCLSQLNSVDLVAPSLKFGRSEECDIIVHKSKFLPEQLFYVSKEHFVITKDPEDVYITYIKDLSKNGTYVNNKLIGRNNMIVLQNNDVIAIGNMLEVYIFKSMKYSVDENYLPVVLKQKYEPSKILGKGACGEVILVYEKLTCKKFAIKKIVKGKNTESQISRINHPNRVQNEIDILQRLSHPLVVSMIEIVETDNEVFIVLEYMEGGELSNRISSNTLTESQCKFFFYQMVRAVQYLHSEGVTHRDLKPGNVLLSSNCAQSLIKVSDFGLSKLSDNLNMKTICGTKEYVAPEVLDLIFVSDQPISGYDKQVDVWSLGVILFHMLSKKLPFISKAAIIKGSYSMNQPCWYEISAAAKDLVSKMLTVNANKRITVEGILSHPWVAKDNLTRFLVENLITATEQPDEDSNEGTALSGTVLLPAKKIKLD